jgi:cell division protein FtsW (lipid II flippase)
MERRLWRSFDFLLLTSIILIIGIGVALIYSATISTEGSEPLSERSFFRQMTFAGSGLLIALFV